MAPIPAKELGIPITGANRIGARTKRGFGPGGHDLLVWTTTAESGGHLTGLDLKTGQSWTHPYRHLEAYPIVFATDGCVYTGSTSGEVWRWNPRTDDWRVVGKPLFAWPGAGLNHVRCLCEGRDGWLYAGSVYGERARLHPESGAVEKLPPLPEAGNWYVSAAETLPDGKIAFGCGHKARVFVYDPATGKDVGQWLPAGWTDDGFVLTLIVGKSVLYATHFPSGRRAAIDAGTGQFLGKVPWPDAKASAPWSLWGFGANHDFELLPGADTIVAFDGTRVHQFDPRQPDLAPTLDPRDFRPSSDLALALRYTVASDGTVLVHDSLRRRLVRTILVPQPKVARNLFGFGVGPDGCVYGGAYQSTDLFRCDPKTLDVANLGDHHPGWSGETFSFTIWKGELITASYTNGAIVGYNPKKPWKASVTKRVNPRRIGFLGQRVYRPVSCCVADDGRVWGVGPAGWGTTGAGIAWIDPKTGKTQSYPLPDSPGDIVPLPGNRVLAVHGNLLRWWDGATNREVATLAPPLPLASATRIDEARVLLAGERELLVADLAQPGTVTVLARHPSPIPITRALVDGGLAVVGGPQGLATIDLATGAADHFCSTPLGLRYAFAVAGGWAFFHNGPKLLAAALTPKGDNR